MNNSINKKQGGRTLFKWIELFAVLLIGFGIFIYSSTLSLFENINEPTVQSYTSFDLYFIVFYELLALSIIAFVLRRRRWSISDFNLDFRISMIAIAIVLIVLRYLCYFSLEFVLTYVPFIDFQLAPAQSISLDLSVISILLMSVVNSVFEELLLIGYLFKRLEGYNRVWIVILSILIRVSFHSYQGIQEIPRVLALGLVLGIYYIKYKKLWPVILAHGIGNLIYFMNEEFNWFDL